ncbi:MAG: hypothetical protein WCV41_02190 [Patescibacteria group bacterium]
MKTEENTQKVTVSCSISTSEGIPGIANFQVEFIGERWPFFQPDMEPLLRSLISPSEAKMASFASRFNYICGQRDDYIIKNLSVDSIERELKKHECKLIRILLLSLEFDKDAVVQWYQSIPKEPVTIELPRILLHILERFDECLKRILNQQD